MAPGPPPAEVLPWLKTLPLAPEYHPTLAEFQDPIAYILKIEKEASLFGICKIVPPLPAAPKKTAVANLNRSFAARSPTKTPTFTTRQQQIGFCPRRPRPVQKPVWQSGERYTLPQFEAKARQFERTHLRKTGKNCLSPLEIETLFWKACADKPFSVEYANDMPGSGFAPLGAGKRRPGEEMGNVAESAWNMRGVSRGKASLLRFMKEEIPGVTSPMVYVAMMFSWFAWHVEDHDLHSMNYLHTGDGKTWYGVPRDAALAFEEVVRVHGYNGEVNPLVTFAILGEKTTVMSPEVLIGAGIPCCRLVQNAGEFVVTFPGAYHSGFSHGFNCAEAANIATPEWLKVAKEAAVRRASTNYPPMLSHFQLLYALALSLCSRMPMSSGTEPRSSRLKFKMRGEGEVMVKDIFVENVIHNNGLLSILLDKGSCCIVLPQYTSDSPLYSGLQARSQIKVKPRLSLGLCSLQEAVKATEFFSPGDAMQERNMGGRHLSGVCPTKGDSFASDLENMDGDKETTLYAGGLLDQGLLSCVMCGILTFACVAVIQPREAAARYLMSADCRFFNDETVDSTETSDFSTVSNWKTHNSYLVSGSGKRYNNVHFRLDHNSAHCSTQSVKSSDQHVKAASAATQKGISALDLLASAYGDSSESEVEAFHEMFACTDETDLRESSLPSYLNENLRFGLSSQNLCSNKIQYEETELHLVGTDCLSAATGVSIYPKNLLFHSAMPAEKSCLSDVAPYRRGLTIVNTEEKCQLTMEFLAGNQSENPEIVVTNNLECDRVMSRSSSLTNSMEVRHATDGSCRELDSRCHNTEIANFSHNDIKMENSGSDSANFYISPDSCRDTARTGNAAIKVQQSSFDTSTKNSSVSAVQRSDKDSSRMHVFCLEHALEVEKQLRPVGGGHIMLLCRPDYPKIEAEARFLANELGFDHLWKDIPYREATEEVRERIRSVLEDEEAVTMNSDWAVKMGINLYYSANLSKSPLYRKQMPYNAVIYKAFGCNSPVSSPTKPKGPCRRPGRQKKISVAGKWCGKVWMSNQVHPHLAHRLQDDNNQEPVDKTDTEHADQVTPPKKNSSCNNVAATRKSRKKRKMPLRRSSTKRPRLAIGVAEDSSAQGGRVPHDGLSKHSATPGCNGISNRLKLNPEAEDGGEGGPSTRLRRRKSKSEVQPAPGRQITDKEAQDTDYVPRDEEQIGSKKSKKAVQGTNYVARGEEAEYPCDVERCTMSFGTKQDLALHRRNICPFKGCGKKFFSHKYLLQHRKVHSDERPIKCPWKGCKMTFKWSWARTEHVRVHTGARPYVCREAGCGKTFRFVSDFSRHKRKTGHPTKKGRR